MKYKISVTIFVAIISLFVLFNLNSLFHETILDFGDRFKNYFLDSKEKISSTYKKYINQSENIENLTSQLGDYQKIKIENIELRDEINKLLSMNNSKPNFSDSVLVRAFSYVGWANYNRVWINTTLSNENKIYGLVRNGSVIGVAKTHEGRALGLLNGDPECSYGVYVGKDKAPGMIKTDPSSMVVSVEYIPSWLEINVGDEVVTNGLDGIFFENIMVGKVSKVREKYGYLSAEIEFYGSNKNLGYMWLIDKK